MTDKQEEIKSKLLLLLQNSSPATLSLNFITPDGRDFHTSAGAKVRRENNLVILNLFDPGLDDVKLAEWNTAIEQATALIEQIYAEEFHQQSSPNFFTAVQAITREHLKKYFIN